MLTRSLQQVHCRILQKGFTATHRLVGTQPISSAVERTHHLHSFNPPEHHRYGGGGGGIYKTQFNTRMTYFVWTNFSAINWTVKKPPTKCWSTLAGQAAKNGLICVFFFLCCRSWCRYDYLIDKPLWEVNCVRGKVTFQKYCVSHLPKRSK